MRKLLLTGAVLALAPPAYAQTDDTITVTADRRPEAIIDSLADTTVITREDLDHLPYANLQQVLQANGGNLVQNGGEGSLSSIALRGSSPAQTLILVNGIRVSSATSGTTAIENIPLATVERVEIVRGPRSVQYGSDAIGGVINIITRDARSKSSIYATAGNLDTYAAGVNLAHSGATTYALDLNYRKTGGYNFSRPTPGPWGVNEPDRDGYRTLNGSLYLAHDFGGTEAWLRGAHSDNRLEYDNCAGCDNVENNQLSSVAVGVTTKLGSWSIGPSLNWARDHRVAASSTFTTERRGANLILTGPTTTIGGEYYRDKVSGTTTYTSPTRDNWAVFGQQDLNLGVLLLSAGGRYENSSQYGDHWTWSAAAGVKVTPNLTLRGSYATAYRQPTFNDLYYPGFSNPNLQPETSETAEIGLTYVGSRGQVQLSAYQTKAKDLIIFSSITSVPENVDRARIRGVSLNGHYDLTRTLTVRGSAELIQPIDEATRLDIRLRPREQATIGLSYHPSRFGVSVDGTYVGKRYADAANLTRMDDYLLIAASAWVDLNDKLRLQVSATNLGDTDYEPAVGYYGRPRTVEATVRYSF